MGTRTGRESLRALVKFWANSNRRCWCSESPVGRRPPASAICYDECKVTNAFVNCAGNSAESALDVWRVESHRGWVRGGDSVYCRFRDSGTPDLLRTGSSWAAMADSATDRRLIPCLPHRHSHAEKWPRVPAAARGLIVRREGASSIRGALLQYRAHDHLDYGNAGEQVQSLGTTDGVSFSTSVRVAGGEPVGRAEVSARHAGVTFGRAGVGRGRLRSQP